MNNRLYNLDIIRIIACVMIVAMHSPMPGLGTPGIVLSGISYMTAPGIGLFFMVSGALLLKPECAFDTSKFLRKRLIKILVPLIFWSFVGIGLDATGVRNTELGVLWFMYTLAGLYLLTPILSRWLAIARRSELEFYLLIWFVTMCVPFVKLLTNVNESDTGWMYYFHGYVGYYVLGYYLCNCKLYKFELGGVKILFTIFSLVSPIAIKVTHADVDFYSMFWYLSISVALCCVIWWVMIDRMNVEKWLSVRVKHFIAKLSNLCFGIYLVHILVMRNVLWKTEWMQNMNGLVQIVVCTVLTFSISAFVSWSIMKVKYLKTIVGG